MTTNLQKVSGLVRIDGNYQGPMAPRVIVQKLSGNSAPFFVHRIPSEILEAVAAAPLGTLDFVLAFGMVENQGFEWIPGLSKYSPLAAEDLKLESTEAPEVTLESTPTSVEEVRKQKAEARERRRAAATKADSAVQTGDATAV